MVDRPILSGATPLTLDARAGDTNRTAANMQDSDAFPTMVSRREQEHLDADAATSKFRCSHWLAEILNLEIAAT